MTWLELCNDKKLQELPYKIELNRTGQIIMSPTRNLHGYLAGKIARLLGDLMGSGEVLVELAIETEDSTKVADVAWAAPRTFSLIRNEASCSVAPEICVEVRSPGNSAEEIARKRQLYLSAGAKEYWVCGEHGRLQFFDPSGKLDKSVLCPPFPAQLPM